MANTVFNRVDYNFDSINFEGAEALSEGAINNLETRKTGMYTWQYEDMANSLVSRTRYFRNPTANLYIQLYNTANTINILASNLSLSNIATSANQFMKELVRFKSHTDNVSGVLAIAGRNVEYNIPQYETAISVGEQAVSLLYSTDNVANTVGALGSFTSLFINGELTANATILASDYTSLNNSVIYSGLPLTASSNLGGVAIEAINAHISTANSMISARRLHDWNFFQQTQTLISEFGFVSQFNSMGKARSHLVYNLIGTDALIANVSAPIVHDANTGVFPT